MNQKVDAAQVFIKDEWKSKTCYIRTMQCKAALKREGFLTHALTWRDLESIMLSEICQKEKDNYCITPLIEGPLNRQIHRDGK